MSKALEAGKSLADLILAKLPESLRDSVKTALTAPEATDALTLLGDSALARADYSRSMDDLKAKEAQLTEDYTKLNDWWATKQAEFAEYEKLKDDPRLKNPASKPPVDPNAPPPVDPSKFVSKEDFEKLLRAEQMQAANFMGLQNALTLKHFQDFGEVLDTRELLADKKLGTALPDGRTYGLIDAYQTKYSDKLSERDKAREDARIKKLVDEGVAERMKGVNPAMVPIRPGASPLDVLDSKTEPNQFSPDAAAQEYLRLQEARSSAA